MQVLLKPTAEKQLNHLPNKLAQKIALAIQNLAQTPFPPNYAKLQGWNNTYRIRVGDYRVIYFFIKQQSKILITQILHRKDVYRNLS